MHNGPATVHKTHPGCGRRGTANAASTDGAEASRVVHSRHFHRLACPPAAMAVLPSIHTTDDDYETLEMMASPENGTC